MKHDVVVVGGCGHVGLPLAIAFADRGLNTAIYDVNAIAVKLRGETIGYVNRLQTGAFHEWLRDGRVEVTLERMNGPTDRPRAFMFVWVHDRRGSVAA